ncbi:polyphosphate kinase 1 [Oscillatoria sp. CS-180]|uniref:polyphosphate kinase 1 n=1 Tax=Oscillatoria sp. CS-180 TaxID=3021720 RepID=UPI00232F21FC|nr:polyphosphate kinase 1 [Oscillatoria sp. CS-180]MDB9528191.1 polyphosphate kinase 1 [Oscillatoria sp. CS-180]
MLPPSGHLASGHTPRLFDRELSWIAFNRRLLYEVADSAQPILDRLLKLSQASAALDEYFMVKVPFLKGLHGPLTGAPDAAPFRHIHAYLKVLVARQQAHFVSNLKPHLAQQDIHLLDYGELSDFQIKHCQHRFEDEVAPILTALTTSPEEVTPDFSNLSLNLAVCLELHGQKQLSWVKLPRVLSRFMIFPKVSTEEGWVAVPLEQVVAAYLPKIFPTYTFLGCFPFRVTRSADLGTLDSETANLMEMIQESLQQRQQQQQAVRLEVLQSMPAWVRSHLMAHLNLIPEDTYSLSGCLGLSDLKELTRLPRPDLRSPNWKPVVPMVLTSSARPSLRSFTSGLPNVSENLFAQIAKRDLLLHFPYHSFAATVEQFIAQAAVDPSVLAIKMTLYRTAIDAPIVRSLITAAKAEKQVVVLVELTAPLDEAINIHWAKSLEKAGAHVVYGVVGFRTHTNLALIVRQEAEHIRQYAYIGTGDYLPDRPEPYADLGLLTSRSEVGIDLNHLFNFLTGCSRHVDYTTLMVAPEKLRAQLKDLIAREAQHAQAGRAARLIVKLNLLADPDLIEALYAASQAGVEIDLIVRGICRLRPGVEGMSDRIQVVSVLGQYVEHSRTLYCCNGNKPEAWIGTADWTPRGLDERIEVMVPLKESELIVSVYQQLECLLADNQNSWRLSPTGQYIKQHPPLDEPMLSAQAQFQHQARSRKQISQVPN